MQKVQYYRDSNVLLGTSLSAPFDFSWDSTTVTTGTHTLYAVATDTAGNTATSTTISVTVDRTLPTVSMTAPSSGAWFPEQQSHFQLRHPTTLELPRVDFYRDSNVLVGTDNTAPYGMSWDSTSTPAEHIRSMSLRPNCRQYQDFEYRQRHCGQHWPRSIAEAPANGGRSRER